MTFQDGVEHDDALVEALASRRDLPVEQLDDDVALALAAWVGELDTGLPPVRGTAPDPEPWPAARPADGPHGRSAPGLGPDGSEGSAPGSGGATAWGRRDTAR